MDIKQVSPEFAEDFIKLVNGCKGITYNASVNYVNRKSGNYTSFKYVTLDKIYLHVKSDGNFALIEPLGTNEQGESALQIVLIHKSGEAITSDYYKLRVPENGSKQDEGAAITYTKRYALGSFLGLCTDEDNDANPDGDGMPASGRETPPTLPQYITAEQGRELVKLSCEIWGDAAQKEFAKLTGFSGVKFVPENRFLYIKKQLEKALAQ